MRSLLFLVAALSLSSSALLAQPAVYRVALADRIDGSDTIIEGRVLSQRAFWNEDHTLINTASRVEVYRIFKGDPVLREIEVITPGGVLGLDAMRVEPSLRIIPREVGLFFLTGDAGKRVPYASVQGFVRYDEILGLARDTFDSYPDIESDLHGRIESRLARPARVLTPFKLRLPPTSDKTGQAPIINSLSPSSIAAGTGSELLISGSGFETNTAQALVAFPNADLGGASLLVTPASDIISWTDTAIRVRVPSGAGSGNVLVQTPGQLQGQSPSPLTVLFNHVTLATGGVTGLLPDLRSKNAAGGYSFSLSTNTANGGVDFSTSAAATAFNTALETWRAGTGFNGLADGGNTSSRTVDPQADPDIVMFDNDSAPLPAGLLGRATSGYSSCNGTTWWVEGVDVEFRRNGTDGITWNFGGMNTPLSMFDFESVALHELGHVHQLGHVIDPASVMHFTLTNGTDLRELNPVSEVDGGLFVMGHSVLLNDCGQTGMQPLFSVDIASEQLPAGYVVSDVYPNPFVDDAALRLTVPTSQAIQVDAYDLLGRRVRHLFGGTLVAGSERVIVMEGRDLPPGMYLVVVQGQRFRAVRKLVRI